MAVDGKSEPPRTLAEWRTFDAWCKLFSKWAWLPTREDAFWPRKGGSCWHPVAEDHPFKGEAFCWRCIVRAQGWKTRSFAHTKHPGAICWKPPAADRVEPEQATRDYSAEDGEQNSGETGTRIEFADGSVIRASAIYITKLDPTGRPIGPRNRIDPPETGPEDFADTGTIFWDPAYAASVPVDFRDSWPPSWTDFDPTNYPGGWCAPADTAPDPEPLPAHKSERPAQYDAQPVEAHPADDADRQPGTDEAP